jgi:hypothetical protein
MAAPERLVALELVENLRGEGHVASRFRVELDPDLLFLPFDAFEFATGRYSLLGHARPPMV